MCSQKCHNNVWNSRPPLLYISIPFCLPQHFWYTTLSCVTSPTVPPPHFYKQEEAIFVPLKKENWYLVSHRAFGYWRQWRTDVTWSHVSLVLNVRRRGWRQRCVGTIWWSLWAGGGGWERPQLWRRSGTDCGGEVIHHRHTRLTSCNSAP